MAESEDSLSNSGERRETPQNGEVTGEIPFKSTEGLSQTLTTTHSANINVLIVASSDGYFLVYCFSDTLAFIDWCTKERGSEEHVN